MSPAPGPIAPHLTRRAEPDEVFADYLAAIKAKIAAHPRTLQVRVGPSELGDECLRRLGYKLLEVPERDLPPNWKATVGTACHEWAEGAFDADNVRRAVALEGQERWLIESELTVGFVPGYGFVTGHSDLYDRVTGFNLDHKFLGRNSLEKYRRNGPSIVYKAQAHLYGQGWRLAGYPVDQVAICMLPRDGELRDGFMWSEPFNADAAQWALDRLAGLWRSIEQQGRDALPLLPTADSYCSGCPWFRPGSTDLTQGCPGDPNSRAATQQPPLTMSGSTPSN